MLCWSCRGAVDPPDNFCRHCGSGLGENVPWYYEKVWIGVLTVFALGPFALPLVWRSPRFDEKGRWIAGALVAVVGAYQLYACCQIYEKVRMAMSMIQAPM